MIEASVLLHHKNDVIDGLQTAVKRGCDGLRAAFGNCAAPSSAAGSAPPGNFRPGKRAGSERDPAALKAGAAGLAAVNSRRGTAHHARLRSRERDCESDRAGATGEPLATDENRC